MLQAFVDDSIAGSGEKRLYLAAYVHRSETWAEFSDAWDAELRAYPPIDYFKMAEAHCRGGQFRRFSEAQRNRKVFALAQVIRRFSPWGLHTSVSTDEFNRVLKPHVPFPMATPYFLLFYGIVMGVARVHAMLNVDVPCDFVFDQHDGLPAKVLPLFEAMLSSRPDWRLLIGSTPTFRDDKAILPLQAADMLAWHVRRQNEGTYPPEYRGLIDLITVENVHRYTEVTTEVLELLAEQFNTIPGAAELNDKREWTKTLEHMLAVGAL